MLERSSNSGNSENVRTATPARIALLTHASTELAMLNHALTQLPADFPATIGINLQNLTGESGESSMSALLQGELAEADIIVLRILGRLGSVAGFAELLRHAQAQGRHLIALSGTGEPDAELAAVSTVPADILRQALAYFHGGGSVNLAQFLRFVSDRLLLTGFTYEATVALPEHGIYHPDLEQNASLDDWLRLRASHSGQRKPSVGIIFYRAHWISGNTRFIDALIAALEQRGIAVLPVFTASLRNSAADSALPAALQYFSAGEQGAHVDVLINTTSFAMGEITPGAPTPAGWSVSALERLNVPVLQAMTSGMTLQQWQQSSRGMNPLDAAMNVVLPEFDGRIISVPLSFKAQAAGHSDDVVEFQPLADRVERIAGLLARFARLRTLANADKRIAFIFTNSNSKASQIGNAVGLDAPASLMHILQAMRAADYRIDDLPDSGTALIHQLI